MKKIIRITHRLSGELIAEGPVGWGITPFENAWYVSWRYLRTGGFRTSGVPGLCPYKFVYVWLHFRGSTGHETEYLGWRYVLPNPLFPFIAFRVAVPGRHGDLDITVRSAQEWEDATSKVDERIAQAQRDNSGSALPRHSDESAVRPGQALEIAGQTGERN